MRKWTALLLAAAMACSLAACGGKTEAPQSESSGGSSTVAASEAQTAEEGEKTLKVGTMNVLGTFLPGNSSGQCYWGMYLIYDYLFDYDADGTATSQILDDWYYEEDGSTFVMVLKDGITFANGDKMTGEDVLFSIQTLVDRETKNAAWYSTIDFEASSVGEDGLTVTLVNTKPFGPGITGSGTIFVLDKSWCEEKGFDNIDDWTKAPNGSGPYEVVEYATDAHATLKVRDGYWGDFEPVADTVVINHYADVSALYMALETGELDIALNIAGTDYSRALEDDKVNEYVVQEGENIMLVFDNANQYLSDKNLRLAIAHGVNWEEVAESAVGKDMAKVGTSAVTSMSPYYVNVGAYEYDPEKAKQYLEAAGYKSDGSTQLNLTMNTVDQAVKKNAATVIQYYLQELGINLTVNYTDFPTAVSKWKNPGGTDINFQDTDTGSPLVGEPYASLRYFPAGMERFPVARIEDETFLKLFDEANYTTDIEVRKEKYAELQKYVKEEAFFIPLYESVKAIAYNPETIEECGLQSAIAANLRNVVMK